LIIKYYILIIFTILFSQDFSIKPKIDYSYYSDGGELSYGFQPIHSIRLGVYAVYKKDKYDIFGSFDNNVLFGILDRPNDFNRFQGPSSFGNHFKKNNIWDYSRTSMKFEYKLDNFKFYLGKFNNKWGNGIYSINLSNKAPSYPQVGFIFNINPSINYEYIHGQLNSLLINESNSIMYINEVTSTTRQDNIFRNIVAHKLTFKLTDNIIVSGSESIIYANRNFDFHYLPFAAFFTIKDYLGDKDNLQLNADLKFIINDKNYIYTGLYIDEFDPLYIFDKNNQNWIIFQSGIDCKDLLVDKDNLKFEYSWADHRVYRNKLSVNNYYSHNYPLGLWSGPHSEVFYATYGLTLKDYKFKVSYMGSKRGELTDQMLDIAYQKQYYARYSNNYEQKNIVSFFVEKKYLKHFILNIGYEFIDWDNAGFNPVEPDITFNDIIKHSINFNVKYIY
tara:strand:- start:307 stop:1647 length:1341 start_codon:yes stop_codon:yes gene_type:complete